MHRIFVVMIVLCIVFPGFVAPGYSQSIADTVTAVKNQASDSLVLRQLYNEKVRQADSEFNINKNLLRARELYREATLMGQDKNYPADQIVEIDKQLTEKLARSYLSRTPVKVYIMGGVIIVLVALILTGLFLVSKKRARSYSTGADPDRRKLEKSLKSKNELVRIEAELALMGLDREDPFSFLDLLNREFTPLEQLIVVEMAKRDNMVLPDFSRWLHSSNPSVVLFCKRMTHSVEGYDRPGIFANDLQSVALHILKSRIR